MHPPPTLHNQTAAAENISEIFDSEMSEDGERIDFAKGELIGSGAFGKVYQGLDINSGQLIAIKNI